MNLLRFVLCGSLLACAASVSSAQDPLVKQLESNGVRVQGNLANLTMESQLAEGLRDITELRRDVTAALKNAEDFKRTAQALEVQITLLNQQSAQLNSDLTRAPNANVGLRLAGAINTIQSRLRLAYQQQEQLEKKEADVHARVSKARDSMVAHILSLQQLVGEIRQKYQGEDKTLAFLLKQYHAANGVELKLQPSLTFEANVRRVQELAGEIVSADVPLRRDRNTYWATVAIGEETLEMVVDSGASLVSLPFEVAVKLGIKPGKDDPEIRLGLADGSVVTGHRMKVKSMRVGKFMATDVDCAVLGVEAKNAEPLLGMSFLHHFKFELDSGQSLLRMTSLGTSPSNAGKLVRPGQDPQPSVAMTGEVRHRILFPANVIQQVKDLDPAVFEVNGEFSVDGTELTTQRGQTTALQISQTVSDFDLEMEGDFTDKGLAYWLLGWHRETSSGYMLRYDRLVNFGQWRLLELQDGAVVRIRQVLADKPIASGRLQVSILAARLSIKFDNNVITANHPLDNYEAGEVIFGTSSAQYPGKLVRLKKVEITETTAELRELARIEPPRREVFANLPERDLLTPGSDQKLETFPVIGTGPQGSIQASQTLQLAAGHLTSIAEHTTTTKLHNQIGDFELTASGNLAARGVLYWLIGWNNEQSSGYRIDQNQLIRGGAWSIDEVGAGKTTASSGDLANKRLGADSQVTLRVVGNVLAIEVDGVTVIEKFVLDNYQPGSLYIGTTPNQYKGRAVDIRSLKLRAP